MSNAIWPKLDANATKILVGLDRSCLKSLVGVISGHCSIGEWDGGTHDEDIDELKTLF